MAKTNDEVVFLDADGNEISNDPRFLARKTLEAAGVDTNSAGDEELKAENARLQAQIAELLAGAGKSEDLEDDGEAEGDYSDVKGKDLVNLAKDRGIELTVEGKKLTAPEVRAALVAQDKAQA
jgi:hypothetical protein